MSRNEIRAERRARSQARKKRRRMILVVGAAVLAGAFIISLIVPGSLAARNTLGETTATTINTGGPVELQPDQGRGHVEPGAPHEAFITRPATSGPHWFVPPDEAVPTGAPADWGVYGSPLPDEVLIHNLEHGGIGIHYDCPDGCLELGEQLRSIPPAGFSQYIVAPYPDMPQKIAITSWRHLMYLDEFDEARIREFIDAYLDRAPESIPTNPF
jgi:hypothetical protein